MILTFRPIKVWPEGWPHGGRGKSSPFQSSYSRTLNQLDAELAHLRAVDVTLQVDLADGDLRLDGQIRSTARPDYRGVILTIESRTHGTLVYPCDTFGDWQSNLRAITLGLEALRKVERYGIGERGQQYAGYREIGAGGPTELGAGSMTAAQAAEVLLVESRLTDLEVFGTEGGIERAYRRAAKRLHPDVGGDPELFRLLQDAKAVLDAE